MTDYSDLLIKGQAARCLLCASKDCTKACGNGIDVARIMRAFRFENYTGAVRRIPENVCENCDNNSCMTSCTRSKIDYPINIKDVLVTADKSYNKDMQKNNIDLSVTMCGVKFENPFLLSSSVVGSNYEMVAKAFDMGWAGVAFKTIGLFVPDEVSPRFEQLERESEPFVGFKNIEQISDHTLEENLEFFRRLKRDYPTKIIIASIMGQNEEEWTRLAGLVEEAGADIIECNFSCPQMVGEGLGSDVGINPELVARYTAAAKKGTTLPVITKMTPNITDMTVPAVASVNAGADGLAAINTIKSIMNVNLKSFVSGPEVAGKTSVGGYSGKAVKPIALRFIQDMKKHPLLKDVPISGMGGIENWKDAVEFIAMGCSTIQITTAVMQYGYRIIDDLLEGLSGYMKENGYEKVSQIEGRALENIIPADDLERSTICFPKFDRKKCVACGRCYISCFDGGHQALEINNSGQPVLKPDKCVGCHLCLTVCPAGAISAGARIDKKSIRKIKQVTI